MVFANNQITSVQQSGALGARLVNPISLAYKAPFVALLLFQNGRVTVCNGFSLYLSLDEEEVGPWSRRPAVPFGEEALQRQRIPQVPHLIC